MAAANMTQAALQAGENVQLVANTGGMTLLKTRLEQWVLTLKGTPSQPLDPSQATHRTVMNWIPRGRQLLADLDALIAANNFPADPLRAQGAAAFVSLFVYQSCEAVAEARLSNRISAVQSNAILAQYNVVWP